MRHRLSDRRSLALLVPGLALALGCGRPAEPPPQAPTEPHVFSISVLFEGQFELSAGAVQIHRADAPALFAGGGDYRARLLRHDGTAIQDYTIDDPLRPHAMDPSGRHKAVQLASTSVSFVVPFNTRAKEFVLTDLRVPGGQQVLQVDLTRAVRDWCGRQAGDPACAEVLEPPAVGERI